jgi:phosphoglycerate dehydrogenase-like enzyme
VDIAAAASRGIPVSNVPDYATEEVADHAIALTLALVRQIRPFTRHVAGGGWEWSAGAGARRLRELTFGIVGCGRIGTATALRARALGFRVVFYDPYLPPGFERGLGLERADTLEQLLASSDVVSLHVPLTGETRGLFGPAQFAAMRPGSWFVNTSRGAVVRHEALAAALSNGTLAGAGLDVLEKEPAGALDLLAFPNVLVTPHAAFYSVESLEEVRRTSSGMIRDVLETGRLRHVVNGIQAAAARKAN